MFQDELQNRIHDGDQAALRELYSRYSREIYAIAHTALGNSDSARTVVKQVFYHIYREILRSETDLDLIARLSALTNEEIRILRVASGDLSPDALQAAFFITASAPNTANTMQRIQARMQQQEAAAPVEEAAPVQEAVAESPTSAAAEPAFDPFREVPQDPMSFVEPEDTTAPIPPNIQEPAAAVEEESDLSPAPTKKKSRKGAVIAAIVLIVLLVIFAWLLCGILMDLEILPYFDLGYSLFNKYVFEFFRLS